jgi:hypothetical protein
MTLKSNKNRLNNPTKASKEEEIFLRNENQEERLFEKREIFQNQDEGRESDFNDLEIIDVDNHKRRT